MKKPRNKVVGLAIGERSMLAAEVEAGDGKPELLQVGEFVYPPEVGLNTPEALGKALGQFLKEKGIATRSAVLGVPAKWVLSKSKEVPAADRQIVVDSLRLQAEGEFSPELKDLVYDYAGETSESQQSTVLLMAIPGRYVEQVKAMAEAARLTPDGIMPSVTALGAASARSAKSPMVLLLGRGGAELSAQHGTSPRALRHLGSSGSAAPVLLGELRRAAALINGNGAVNGINGASRRGLLLWDSVGIDPTARRAMGDALGLSVEEGELTSLGITSPEIGSAAQSRSFAPAVSLALAGLESDVLAVDFLHPRLTAPAEKRIDPRVLWGIVAGVAVLLLAGAAIVDYQIIQNGISSREAELVKLDPSLKVAKKDLDKFNFARGFHQGNPRFLACLRDFNDPNLGIPNDGETIVTSFTLHDNMKGSINGKTSRDSSVIALRERLMTSKRFVDVKASWDAPRDSTRSRGEISFQVSFTYVPQD